MWWVRLSNLLYLTLVSLFFTGRTRKSWEKGINNHLTTIARQSWNDICMLQLSKSAMSKSLTSLGISFLSLICPCMVCLKEYMQRRKKKKNQNALYMIVSVSSRRCENYRMYLEGDSPYQAVMIVYELKWFSHISNRHNL